MDMNELAAGYTQKLEALLIRDFAAKGRDLTETIGSIEASLPAELRDFLHEIAGRSRRLNQSREPSKDGTELIFRCGQAFERLEFLKQRRAAENLALLPGEGVSPGELDQTDLDAIARFVAARDKILQTAANYTLKFLLVLVGLLILGVLIGLI